MNTKQAYAKYGRWAVISGYATYARHVTTIGPPSERVGWSLHKHQRWEVYPPDEDIDYPVEAINAIANRARLRT